MVLPSLSSNPPQFILSKGNQPFTPFAPPETEKLSTEQLNPFAKRIFPIIFLTLLFVCWFLAKQKEPLHYLVLLRSVNDNTVVNTYTVRFTTCRRPERRDDAKNIWKKYTKPNDDVWVATTHPNSDDLSQKHQSILQSAPVNGHETTNDWNDE